MLCMHLKRGEEMGARGGCRLSSERSERRPTFPLRSRLSPLISSCYSRSTGYRPARRLPAYGIRARGGRVHGWEPPAWRRRAAAPPTPGSRLTSGGSLGGVLGGSGGSGGNDGRGGGGGGGGGCGAGEGGGSGGSSGEGGGAGGGGGGGGATLVFTKHFVSLPPSLRSIGVSKR
mmetsp:Transcript_11993/g.40107  ORF Transcript_11993/g.40107 Transcript_11993/m.40107 type:complete len:174 (+) Transcript_11993:1-522(+)